LTLDRAVEILVRQSIDLRAKYLEIPQMRADVLTASLRANPILYADSQLVPYGSDSIRKPDGPTQYDLNVSHPLDLSHKRRARIAYASRALQVTEAQYQNEVRLAIANLHAAFVDVLSARVATAYMKESVKGFDEVVRVAEGHYEKRLGTRSDVDQAKSDRASAVLGVIDAEEMLQKRKRVLGEMLYLSPEDSERLEVRGVLRYESPQPPPLEALIAIAREGRPDLDAYRKGIEAATANVRLQRANRFSDAYLLFQPYTFQNNAPFGRQSGTSWALGITMPLPLYNRNQGNIERARINVVQSQAQLELLDRRLVAEIQQAVGEYNVSAKIVRGMRENVVPGLKRAYQDRFELYKEGEDAKIVYLNARRKYNDAVKNYLDSAARHRRSALDLNTIVGQRIMP
jgi:cobalt-zinc-cadmium efflux system outer membrane protein